MKSIKLLLGLALAGFLLDATAADKKIILIAGKQSHGPGDHEFRAGSLLLKKCLDQVPGIKTEVYTNGWPENDSVFNGAAAVLIYADGGGGHPAFQGNHQQVIAGLVAKGVGVGMAHFGVEVPKGDPGTAMQEWIGGYYEHQFSVNPMWSPAFEKFPEHPITRGVQPFGVKDEWYFNMRWRSDMKGITPILVAKPSDQVRKGPYVYPPGPYDHIVASSGREEAMMWAYERPDSGRGFGFTGGHIHINWGNDNYRKTVLNALLWLAKVEVPAKGVESKITLDDLKQNLDPKQGKNPYFDAPAPASSGASTGGTPKAKYRSGLVRSGTVNVDVDLAGAKGLWLVVNDAGDSFSCDWGDWLDPQFIKADGSSISLTDLKWKSATTGHGEVRFNQNAGGNPLSVDRKLYAKGIGTHAPSVVYFEIPEGVTRFKSQAGLDNGGTDQGCGSTVEFMVFTDKPSDSILTATTANTTPANRNGLAAAKDQLEGMRPAAGLEVSLFAAEPMVRNPANMDIDARGRVWVTEGANYRLFQKWGKLRPEGDRIVILEDTNGDGEADKETTFYQGNDVNTALGICVLGNKVIVSSAPNVFVFTDTNGDDKADTKEILFTGISGADHDHGVHAVSFGPDGKLYFNQGNDAKQIRKGDGSPITDLAGNIVDTTGKPYRQGLAFRCNLDGSEFEVLGHNFRNNYEVAVDSFGTLWQSDNDDDGNKAVRINYVMEFGNYGFTDEKTGAGWQAKRSNLEAEIPARHWHLNDPGVVPTLLITGAGSPTGLTVYEGKLLPEIFQNQIIHCDAGPRVVRAYPVQTDGAGYKATMVDVLTSTDTWFRPSDVTVAPDGSLYVADWNDGMVGGHHMVDQNLETMTGRIYRVAPKGNKAVAPKPDFTSVKGCIAALQSPNNSTRYLAWTKLHELQGKAEKELVKVWKDNDDRQRARALHLLARIKGEEQKYVEQALKDKSADIRITGLRIARELKLDVIPLVKKLVKDSSPAVRRECAIALRHSQSAEAPKLWAQLAQQHDGKDRWYLEALGIGADRNEDKYFAAWLTAVGNDWNTPAGRDIVWRSRSKQVPALLVKIISDSKTTEVERARYFRALDFISGAEKDAALVELLTVAAPTK